MTTIELTRARQKMIVMTCKDYGKRFEAWDKCEVCEDIMACSVMTLSLAFGDKIDKIVV